MSKPRNFLSRVSYQLGFYVYRLVEAPADIRDCYIDKRISSSLRKPGAANPVRYIDPIRYIEMSDHVG
jgi:hypothetical protein